MTRQPFASDLSIVGCHTCGLVCEDRHTTGRACQCPRCGSTLHHRRPNGIARAWALLLTAIICYIPAPVSYTHLTLPTKA